MRATPLSRNLVFRPSSASSVLRDRVRRPAFLEKLVEPDDLAPLFKNDDYIGWSGFTGVGYPKRVPTAIADHVEMNNLQSKNKFNLFVGASVGQEVEDRWAALDIIARRYPHQVGKEVAKGINAGRIEFADKHLSMFPQDLTYGYYSLRKKHGDPKKPLDWAIVEATAITEDGHIVPGASVGASPEILESAEKIIIEVNTHLPNLEGLHDISASFTPPHRQPYLISHPEDRIGKTSIAIDPDRVVAICESHLPDNTGPNSPETEDSKAIAGHLIEFLSSEVEAGRLPKSLLPLQSGIGNVANSIIGGLAAGPFDKVMVWTEVLQDTFLQFFDSGKLDFATATSIKFSPEGFDHFYSHWADYKDRLLLRSQQVANAPEIIRRLGVIAMNTPLEVDIYAHANSTCALGSRMLNGLGGSADFLRNAKLSIMHTPSSRPTKTDPTGISCIVPFASHIDQTEHDLDVIVTEQGLADLRGLSPRERAPVIINKCAHPDYKDLLLEYYERSLHECLAGGRGHEPHMLRNAFKFHTHLMEHGTMKVPGWD
ncbi:putative acetyl-CoA hydrolase [Favolaschia claudopus]|uniref:Acetyl-CoA hydrolase n=1 Tax=Favolaschia claudopus TaxID=2862362 RepID=A0AAW0CHK0_9AGAR